MDMDTMVKKGEGASPSERRQQPDRRHHSWRSIGYGACCGRRQGFRRQDTPRMQYVDLYGLPLFISSLGVFILCCLDSYLTLELLRTGARELNPLMDMLLKEDVQLFLGVKFTLTAVALGFLVLHKNFLLLNLTVGSVIHIFLASYLCLVGYELTLLMLTQAS